MPRPQSTDDLQYFDPRERIDRGKNRLPHWDQSSAACFITFRLADSIPQDQLDQLTAERTAWLDVNPSPHTPAQESDYHQRFTVRVESWLDAGSGACLLRDSTVRAITARALSHFDGDRHWQHAWVIMPNHVHALFSPIPPHSLKELVQSWKGFTARETNRVTGNSGAFWMKDYFDRLVRDAAHFWRCAHYIRRNPEKAKLTRSAFTLFEAPFVRDFLNAGAPTADASFASVAESAAGKPPFR